MLYGDEERFRLTVIRLDGRSFVLLTAQMVTWGETGPWKFEDSSELLI